MIIVYNIQPNQGKLMYQFLLKIHRFLNALRNSSFPKSFKNLDPAKETILVVSHDGSRTGAPILVYNLIEGFAKKYNVIVLFLKGGPIMEVCRSIKNVEVLGPRANAKISFHRRMMIEKIYKLTRIKFALINSIESRYVLPYIAKNHTPIISLIHEFAAYTRPPNEFKEGILLSNKAVFSAKITRDNALSIYPSLRSIDFPIIPQGLCIVPQENQNLTNENENIQQLLRPTDFSEDGFVIIGAGSVNYRKGVDLFIQVAAALKKLLPETPLRFVWIGEIVEPFYERFLPDQISRSGLQEEFQFMDAVSDLTAVYKTADFLLLTSRLDPLPNVAIDALSMGLPMICFDKTTGIADILKANDLGKMCVANYLDVADMVQKVTALIQNKELYTQVSEKSAKLAAETFNMENYIAQIDQLALGEIKNANNI